MLLSTVGSTIGLDCCCKTNVLCYPWGRKVRDSVTEAVAEVPDSCLRSGMQPVVETLVKDVARDLVTVSA